MGHVVRRGSGWSGVAVCCNAWKGSTVGGLGGCPFAPNATGNIGTEDLVYMLERAGFETGYDLGRLIETAQWMAEILGKPPAASVSRAGSFPNA